MRQSLAVCASALVLLTWTFAVAADAPPARPVFAHYMVCFGSPLEFYKQEIALAQRHGIDGFALNCGDWRHKDAKTGQWKDGPYVASAERLYEAARQLNSGFKLFFSADVNNLRDLPMNMGDMVTRFYDHPNQFRHGEQRVISAWAGQPQSYRETLDKLKAEGRKVCFVPFLYPPKFEMAWSYETVLDFFQDQPHLDGIFFFAADDSVNGLLRSNAMGRRVTQRLGKIYMAGACPAMNSPNLRDFRGVEGYGAMWESLIRDGADWVELVTWNDYQEDTNLMPFRWPNGGERRYFDRDGSFLDVTGYYSAWYKTGRPPAITQDKLYVCYRNRSHWLRQAWDEKTQVWGDVTFGGRYNDQIHDDVCDLVYATTFLTAPATLTVQAGGKEYRFEQPAGIGHAAVPLVPGVPQFALTRTGQTAPVLAMAGRKQIVAEATPANSVKGAHLLNRTWTCAAAAGSGPRLAAAAGQLTGGATVETANGRQVVRNREQDGSGVTLAVTGLKTGTYNVRVTYRNEAATEARLTLTANAPVRDPNSFPYYIPLWLPPTPPGQFGTTSFFWSLDSATTQLDLLWRRGAQWSNPTPEDDDRGSVQLEAVELVAVAALEVPSARATPDPELVAIPGGSFTMGTEQGQPDEKPAHEVTLAPFAIGKYEVTNAEYERFDPEHRRQRDGFSWRDREPAIYVSWPAAAKYCNWLSRQNGLSPVYDEKTWAVVAGANGFRLPTEAEWEYVATGRGENRPYPWGQEPPDASRGHFELAKSLVIDPRLPASWAEGVHCVGDFPAGASRDGVMDLAGNVAEWCSDTLVAYAPGPAVDPLIETPSPYRTIRGGTWGYYNYSQRSKDREFNHPGYPGYIYIGFRVAIGQAGYERLRQAGP